MTNLSVSYRNSSNYYIEAWQNFGDNLERYIRVHEKELAEKSYDVILGFSRDGAVLAFVFSCLLKDILINPYSKKSKASVRAIPRGITVNGSDSCLMMDKALTPVETQDIVHHLEKDLSAFSETYNDEKPINVLILDNHPVGTSRVKFLIEKLDKMRHLVACCDLITYDELRENDHLVMPWHIDTKNAHTTQSTDKYIESWEHFGNNLEGYIRSHETELIEKSYDVILGFSRGGVVLSYAFSNLLKEILIDTYSKQSKASVRPIPIGITVKESDPCFVMDQPSTPSETQDIVVRLKEDLADFSRDNNNNNPINVLIMDDNLTGATRLKFLKDELRKMECVANHETLAYVRHNKFKEIKTIIKFPDNIDYFVMPWHVDHGKKNLDVPSEEPDITDFRFCIKLSDGFENFKSQIINLKNKAERPYIFDEDLITNSGKTIGFYMDYIQKNESNFVELEYTLFLFYPPKKCLLPPNSSRDEHNENFHPLCNYGLDGPMKPSSIGVCLVCSCLNCGKKMIRSMMDAGGETISFDVKSSKIDDIKLKKALKKWFAESMPDIRLDNYE